MLCPASILSSTFALSLLRHASPPDESYVLSPFSLGSALAIVHDGAIGPTQNEMTQLLLKGCTTDDVMKHYSALTTNILEQKENNGVTVNIANRYFVDQKISLLPDYRKHVETEYRAEVDNIKFEGNEAKAAAMVSKFVEDSTNGKIKDMITADDITSDTVAMLVNAVYFHGKWDLAFKKQHTSIKTFHGAKGDREEQFMSLHPKLFPTNFDDPLVTAVMIPYKDKSYNFFVLLPKEDVTLEKARNEIDGERLQKILDFTSPYFLDLFLPRFKMESKMNGKEIMKAMGVKTMFSDKADFSKMTTTHLEVTDVMHNAVIEVNEQGTEAAAATVVMSGLRSGPSEPFDVRKVIIDRPSLIGIIKDNNILFIGQIA